MNAKFQNKRDAARLRCLRQEIEEETEDAYLGTCPECTGGIFGEFSDAECCECGWNNRTPTLERRNA